MIVVADTAPLQYLILIQRDHILPALYGRVVVPPAVIAELSRDETPQLVRDWLTSSPEWLEGCGPRNVGQSSVPLGAGELEAIALAEELSACLGTHPTRGSSISALRWIASLGDAPCVVVTRVPLEPRQAA